jgi:hypothetical protein
MSWLAVVFLAGAEILPFCSVGKCSCLASCYLPHRENDCTADYDNQAKFQCGLVGKDEQSSNDKCADYQNSTVHRTSFGSSFGEGELMFCYRFTDELMGESMVSQRLED